MSRPYSQARSSTSTGHRRASTLESAIINGNKAAMSSSKHSSRKPGSSQRDRRSSRGTASDYEDVLQAQSRQQPILKKQKYYEDGDYISEKKRLDPIYNPKQGSLKPNPKTKEGSKGRHTHFHESTADPARKSSRHSRDKSQNSSAVNHLKSLMEWKKSVANILDKSQLSAVDRFRRRTLAFRTAVCIGLVLATAAVVAAIMGTVYYVRIHRQPVAKAKVHVLASINGTLRILDMPFTNVLELRDSAEFKKLEEAICATIRDAVVDSSFCTVNKFRNGSVIADFQFKVNLPSMNEGDQKVGPMGGVTLMPNRRDEIMLNVSSKRLSKLGHKFNLFIDPEFARRPEVDLFMAEVRTQKIVRIADVQPVLDNKDIEELCSDNSTELLDTFYFADRTDCRAFLVCDGSQLYRLTCGEGTAWNDEEVTCDFKSKTNCTYEGGSGFDDDEIDLPNEDNVDGMKKAIRLSKEETKRKLEKLETTTTTTTTTTEPAITRYVPEGRHVKYKPKPVVQDPPARKAAVDPEDYDEPQQQRRQPEPKKNQLSKDVISRLDEDDYDEPVRTTRAPYTTKQRKIRLSPLEEAAAAAEATKPPPTTEKVKVNTRPPLDAAVAAVAAEIRPKKLVKKEEDEPRAAPAKPVQAKPTAHEPTVKPQVKAATKPHHTPYIGDTGEDTEDYVPTTKVRKTKLLAPTAAPADYEDEEYVPPTPPKRAKGIVQPINDDVEAPRTGQSERRKIRKKLRKVLNAEKEET